VEAVTLVAWKTRAVEAAQCVRTVGKHVTRTVLALVFVWNEKEEELKILRRRLQQHKHNCMRAPAMPN
jgi:hypothetical protein